MGDVVVKRGDGRWDEVDKARRWWVGGGGVLIDCGVTELQM